MIDNLAKAPAAAARAVAHTLRHPRHSAGEALGLVRGAAAAFVAGRRGHGHQAPAETAGDAAQTPSAQPAAPRKDQGDPIAEAAQAAVDRSRGPAEVAQPRPEVMTEPSAPAARADADEIDEALDEALEEDTEIETPVGTTGADVAHNPHTGETDLQQPGTEPLVDPSTTKRIKSESDILRKAADPDKG